MCRKSGSGRSWALFREPADAFMVFQLGRMGQCPPERVMEVYKTRHGQGWGAMAKELGIKPGSAEFHALKRGDLRFDGRPQGGQGKGKDKEHGKGHGQGAAEPIGQCQTVSGLEL